jgi:hypothetical protein
MLSPIILTYRLCVKKEIPGASRVLGIAPFGGIMAPQGAGAPCDAQTRVGGPVGIAYRIRVPSVKEEGGFSQSRVHMTDRRKGA